MIYLALSIALHLAFVVPMLLNGGDGDQGKEKKQGNSSQVEISIIVPKETKPSEILLAEKSKDGIKQKKTPKKKSDGGFYGIGINIGIESINYGHYTYFGYRVNYIFSGYAAERYGLKKNDIIFLVDGMPITDTNDVKGDGPRKMTLTIQRDGRFIEVYIERDYVQTERKDN